MGKGPGAGLHQAYRSNRGEEEAGVEAERAREEGRAGRGTGQVIQGLVSLGSLGEDLDFYPREVGALRAVRRERKPDSGAHGRPLVAVVGGCGCTKQGEAGLVQVSHDVGPGGGKREGRNGWTLDMFEGRAPGRFPEVLDVDGEPKRGVKDDPKDFACLER